jgi:hypothetical protein
MQSITPGCFRCSKSLYDMIAGLMRKEGTIVARAMVWIPILRLYVRPGAGCSAALALFSGGAVAYAQTKREPQTGEG